MRPSRILAGLFWIGLAGAPGWCGAQLQPGTHLLTPQVGVALATNDLMHSTAEHPTNDGTTVDVVADIGLDPGAFAGLRYVYALTRRLAVEGEFGFTASVCAIQLLELDAEADPEGEPQYEVTTLDAHIYQYFLNLNYFLGPWGVVTPNVTVGVGQHVLDLKQKGEVNFDSIYDRAFLVGLGVMFNPHPRLGIRIDVRDYMYNFHFDNQFADERSADIIAGRDIGLNVAEAGARFQNDVVISLAFQIRPF